MIIYAKVKDVPVGTKDLCNTEIYVDHMGMLAGHVFQFETDLKFGIGFRQIIALPFGYYFSYDWVDFDVFSTILYYLNK